MMNQKMKKKYSRATHEFDYLRHLHLCKNSAAYIISEAGRVSDAKSVRPLDRDLTRLASIEFLHALNLSEGDKITVLETVSSLIQTCHKAFVVLWHDSEHCKKIGEDITYFLNRHDHSTERLFACRINASKFRTEVVENRSTDKSEAEKQCYGPPAYPKRPRVSAAMK